MSPGAQLVEVRRFWWRGVAGALLLVFFAAVPAAAQDQGLESPSSRQSQRDGVRDGRRGPRLPALSPPVGLPRPQPEQASVGTAGHIPCVAELTEITGVSDVGGFVEKLGIAAIIPGLEVEIPVGSRGLVRPFGEVGIGKSSDSSAEVFYGAGLRARTTADPKKLHITYGGKISGRRTPEFDGTAVRYVSFEGGADVQVPLGFSVRDRQARGGLYVIGRHFEGLELERFESANDLSSRTIRNRSELLDRARSAYLENPAAVAGRRLPVRPRFRRPDVRGVPVLIAVDRAARP